MSVILGHKNRGSVLFLSHAPHPHLYTCSNSEMRGSKVMDTKFPTP